MTTLSPHQIIARTLGHVSPKSAERLAHEVVEKLRASGYVIMKAVPEEMRHLSGEHPPGI